MKFRLDHLFPKLGPSEGGSTHTHDSQSHDATNSALHPP